MIIALWIATGILALLFAVAGTVKMTQPRAKLATNMGYVEDFTDTQVKLIGATEVIGAIGLIVPAATGIAAWLTPTAAFALAIVMIVAVRVHVRRSEPSVPAIVLAVFAALVGVGWIVFG